MPKRSDAARVILGAIAGAAVEATAMVSVLLCPGTLAKVSCCLSLGIGFLGEAIVFSTGWPVRRAAAFVMRGTISGFAREAGTGRARKAGVPFALSRVLLPFVVDGFVWLEGA